MFVGSEPAKLAISEDRRYVYVGLDGAAAVHRFIALLEPDSENGRVFFLTGSGSTRTLQAFDTRTFLPVGSLTVSGVSGAPSSLIRWGADGLAFRTSGGQVFLVRTPLYRAYNTETGQHLYTSSEAEYNALSEAWQREGITAYLASDS